MLLITGSVSRIHHVVMHRERQLRKKILLNGETWKKKNKTYHPLNKQINSLQGNYYELCKNNCCKSVANQMFTPYD
jgi:hypothetical protein